MSAGDVLADLETFTSAERASVAELVTRDADAADSAERARALVVELVAIGAGAERIAGAEFLAAYTLAAADGCRAELVSVLSVCNRPTLERF